MLEKFLHGFVAAAKIIGLNYSFLLSDYERIPWLSGIGITILLALCSILGSLLVGVVLAALLASRQAWLRGPARGLIELLRNTPTLVQLYCAFFVLNMLLNQVLGGAEHNPLTPFHWVVLVLSLHYGAYHAEALRAGIEAVPATTREAALSLGFSRVELLRHVELPLALRFSLPALTSNLINLVKSTALGAAIAVGELTYASLMIWVQRDNVLELMIFIFLIYAVLTYVVARLGRALENYLRMPGYGH
ncbi:amino acid ABC transporter permease [Uliginosibacterium gangwonense]|uniref:amino acid ABC transporter permease n=1 Tax=Uliginosibacterium gangwonense TaxID=392736 RepID=UPI00037A6DEC|nr:amino acid ABC transporter permease [Uliginosibacterium gangwonense]